MRAILLLLELLRRGSPIPGFDLGPTARLLLGAALAAMLLLMLVRLFT